MSKTTWKPGDPDPDSDSHDLRMEAVASFCEAKGLIAAAPRSRNVLLLDIDGSTSWNPPLDLDVVEKELGGIQSCRMVRSRGGNGLHVYLVVGKPLDSEEERLLWQVALGSDLKRELLSMNRVQSGAPHPTMLFEQPSFWSNLESKLWPHLQVVAGKERIAE